MRYRDSTDSFSHYLTLNPIQRKWNHINTFQYPQRQDSATTDDAQSTNEDLNLELNTLTKEKAQLEKVSIIIIIVIVAM